MQPPLGCTLIPTSLLHAPFTVTFYMVPFTVTLCTAPPRHRCLMITLHLCPQMTLPGCVTDHSHCMWPSHPAVRNHSCAQGWDLPSHNCQSEQQSMTVCRQGWTGFPAHTAELYPLPCRCFLRVNYLLVFLFALAFFIKNSSDFWIWLGN